MKGNVRGTAAATLFLFLPACAVLLDFQEPTDLDPASSADAHGDTSTPSDGGESSSDAGPESAGETGATVELEADAAAADGGDDASQVPDAEPLDGASDESDGASSESGPLPIECSSCVPIVPSGWYGPLAIHEGTVDGAPPCSSDFPVKIYDGLASPIAPSAQCSCSCSAPADVTCSTPQTKFYDDFACLLSCGSLSGNGNPLTCARPATTFCDSKKISSFSVTASTAAGGTCTPSATAEVPPVTWGSSVRLCGRANVAAACGDGTCAGATLPPFAATNRCTLRPGTWECPAGYPHRRTFYETAADTRACSTCTCGAAVGVKCEASVSTYDAAPCSGDGVKTQLPVTCKSTTGVERITVSEPVPTGGSCPANGGLPTGAFTPESPTTVCCLE